MGDRRWSLTVLPGVLAVARLDPGAPVPDWLDGSDSLEARDTTAGLSSVTRTRTELSIVCEALWVPPEVVAERDWRALEVAGPLDFSEVGVLASLTASLAGAEVSVFVLSTFDTDYLLVRRPALARAIAALRESGHAVAE